MSDTIEVKYVGALTDGVILAPKLAGHDGNEYVCPHGEWVTLPADLVNGTDHVLDDDGEVVTHGISGLVGQQYVDRDGNDKPCWEVRKTTTKKNDPVAAPEHEG